MKKILFFWGVFLPGILSGQTVQEKVLHLEKGEIYRGMIIPNGDTATIRLKTRSANERIFKKENVDRTKIREVKASYYQQKGVLSEALAIKKGYSLFTDIGILLGADRTGGAQLGLNGELINAYVVNPHFSAGIGAASHHYFGDFTFLPIFANAKGNLLKGDFTPYANASYGLSLPWLIEKQEYPLVSKFEGRRFYQFSLGIKNFFRDRVAFFFEVGMASNRMKATRKFEPGPDNDNVVKEELIYTKNRIAVKFGFQF